MGFYPPLPTKYQYQCNYPSFYNDHDTIDVAGTVFEAQRSTSTTKSPGGPFSALSGGDIYYRLDFTDGSYVECSTSGADIKDAVASIGWQSATNNILNLSDYFGLEVSAAVILSRIRITVNTPLSGGGVDASTMLDFCYVDSSTPDTNLLRTGYYRSLLRFPNVAGFYELDGLHVLAYDPGYWPNDPVAFTVAGVRTVLSRVVASPFVPAGGGVITMDLRTATTPDDVATVLVADVNATTACLYTAEKVDSSGLVEFTAKTCGISSHLGIVGTMQLLGGGDFQVMQVGYVPGDSLATSPFFRSQSTYINWQNGRRQSVRFHTGPGMIYLDMYNAVDGDCDLMLMQPATGVLPTPFIWQSAREVDYEWPIKWIGLGAGVSPTFAGYNDGRNLLRLKYVRIYSAANPKVYLTEVLSATLP